MATAKLRITGTVHFSHAARTKSGKDFIGAQMGAGGQDHLGLDYSLVMLAAH